MTPQRSPIKNLNLIILKWAMIGIIAIIFVLLPESPWWLVSKGRHDQASKVLILCNGRVRGYNVEEQIVSLFLTGIMRY